MTPKIKSEFAILDVLSTKERALLQYQLKKDGPLNITIKGKLTRAWGNYDGVSQEYEVLVEDVEVTRALRKGEGE